MKSDTKQITIKELLDTTTTRLDVDTLAKLRSARTRALDHQRIHRRVPVLAWLGHHGGLSDLVHRSKAINWAVALLFVAFLFSGATLWHNYNVEHEICDVDIAILTDDLPINVFLD